MFAYPPTQHDDAGFAVVTDRFVCLLSADATAETARELFRQLDDDGAGLEDARATLDRVEAVERVALVEILDARTMQVAVRGRVSVGIEGSTATRLSGPVEATWIMSDARDVSSLWLSLEAGAPEGDVLPLARGVVRTSALRAETAAVAAPRPTRAPAIKRTPKPVAVVEPEPEAEPAPEPEPEEHEAEAPEAEAPEAPADEQPAEEELEPADIPAALRVDLDEWLADGGPRWILRLPDGHELDADGTIVIGRKSWEQPEADEVKHVSVPSPKKQISGTHLELAIVDGQLVARDLDSTNGTIVLTPERPPRLLHGGRTTSLQTGDILDLGESFRIVVSNRT